MAENFDGAKSQPELTLCLLWGRQNGSEKSHGGLDMDGCEILPFLAGLVCISAIPFIAVYTWRLIHDARKYGQNVDSSAEYYKQSTEQTERIAQAMAKIAASIERIENQSK